VNAVQLGPLALPWPPLLWALSLAGAGLAATWWTRRRQGEEAAQQLSAIAWTAVLTGFGAARVGWILPAWPAYADEPWRVLDLRDGGWAFPWGLMAAAVTLALRAGQHRSLARPLLGGGVGALLLWGLGHALTGAGTARALPPVQLDGLDGQPRALADLLQGRPTVINLWASWCGPCRVEMPMLAEAQSKHPDWQFLFVNQGEDEARVRAFLASQPYTLQQVWRDPRSALGVAVGSTGLPTTVFVDASGAVQFVHLGVLNAPALSARLQGLSHRAPDAPN